jgi:hypothetical protein
MAKFISYLNIKNSIFSVLILILIIRSFTSYCLFSIPFIIGNVFTGGDKIHFPICIVNPFKENRLKSEICSKIYYLNDSKIPSLIEYKEKQDLLHKQRRKIESKWYFFEHLKDPCSFDIISILEENNQLIVLLVSNNEEKIKCVVSLDQKSMEVNYIDIEIF